MSTNPLTVTIEEAGRLLGIGRDASYRAASRGQIPFIQVGRKRRVPVGKLAELLGVSPDDLDFELDPFDLLGVDPTTQCGAPTRGGRRCGHRPMPGTTRCWQHPLEAGR